MKISYVYSVLMGACFGIAAMRSFLSDSALEINTVLLWIIALGVHYNVVITGK